MTRRVYKFILKTLKEVSFVGTRYYPVDIDPSLSPYTTVLATIWDEDHMVGQVNQTEILAWWSEVYQEPQPGSDLRGPGTEREEPTPRTAGKPEIVLKANNP
ncbi:MAG: hypothetical protein ABI164_05625 [Acidobacteriaceae bacterium]